MLPDLTLHFMYTTTVHICNSYNKARLGSGKETPFWVPVLVRVLGRFMLRLGTRMRLGLDRAEGYG